MPIKCASLREVRLRYPRTITWCNSPWRLVRPEIYLGGILKGAKPADLPARQSIFVINRQTVRTLSTVDSPSDHADEVIEQDAFCCPAHGS